MKNSTLIICSLILTFSFASFTYSNWNAAPIKKVCSQANVVNEPPTFFYGLSSPTPNTITKKKLHNATTVSDLLPDYDLQEKLINKKVSLSDVKISMEEVTINNTKHNTAEIDENQLNQAQIKLLNSADYSTHFSFEGLFSHNDLIKETNESFYFYYQMTVVPEQEATYKAGKKAFIDFLTTQCQPTIAQLQKGNLKFGNIRFTITKAGTISNSVIDSSCGYPSVDERMLNLINNLPDTWNAATDDNGKKVDQTFVFSYGQTGC